jgi:hypothetical protein
MTEIHRAVFLNKVLNLYFCYNSMKTESVTRKKRSVILYFHQEKNETKTFEGSQTDFDLVLLEFVAKLMAHPVSLWLGWKDASFYRVCVD